MLLCIVYLSEGNKRVLQMDLSMGPHPSSIRPSLPSLSKHLPHLGSHIRESCPCDFPHPLPLSLQPRKVEIFTVFNLHGIKSDVQEIPSGQLDGDTLGFSMCGGGS